MATNKEVLDEVRAVKHILTGDSEPEKGVCFRLKLLENKLDAHIKQMKDGNGKNLLFLTPKQQAFVSRWLFRLVLGALVGKDFLMK